MILQLKIRKNILFAYKLLCIFLRSNFLFRFTIITIIALIFIFISCPSLFSFSFFFGFKRKVLFLYIMAKFFNKRVSSLHDLNSTYQKHKTPYLFSEQIMTR